MKIKEHVEDFKVEEIPIMPTLGEGDYVYFWLTKRNWSTIRALEFIAKRCRVSRKRFGFAGTKDKLAVTKQLVSAWKVSSDLIEKLNIKDIEIEIVGEGTERINLGDLTGNKFIVIIRDVNESEVQTFKERCSFKWAPNYFGLQRFGGEGGNHLVGREIILGNLEEAVRYLLTYGASEFRRAASEKWGDWKSILKDCPKYLGVEKSVLNWLIKHPKDYAGAMRSLHKKLRQMFVHAYQSYLFNRALSELIKEKYDSIELDFLDFKLAFPKIDKVFNKELVIPGANSKYSKGVFGAKVRDMLEKDGLSIEHLKVRSMPELELAELKRKAFFRPTAFKSVEDKDITLHFTLPKGSYATVLLWNLFLQIV